MLSCSEVCLKLIIFSILDAHIVIFSFWRLVSVQEHIHCCWVFRGKNVSITHLKSTENQNEKRYELKLEHGTDLVDN